MAKSKWKPPKEALIGGMTYTIKTYAESKHLKSGWRRAGYVNFRTQTIHIQRDHPDDMKATLLHEILHVIFRQVEEDIGMDEDLHLNEDLVHAMVRSLRCTFKGNKIKLF